MHKYYKLGLISSDQKEMNGRQKSCIINLFATKYIIYLYVNVKTIFKIIYFKIKHSL